MRNWLIAIRRERGLLQKTVAEQVHLSQPSYCNIENGKRNPEVNTAKAIAAVLGFDWTRFYQGDADDKKQKKPPGDGTGRSD